MSTYAEQPFTEFEERYFLAEILKKSSLPPSALLAIIRDSGIEPAWNDIALPNGRSVSACQRAYGMLQHRSGSVLGPPVQYPPPQRLEPAPAGPSRHLPPKRPFPFGEAPTILPRELQPRPPFATPNGQEPLPGLAQTQMSPIEPQRKKRGRPTKSEWERRQAEARERGEIWPKPRKPKARPSVDSAEGSRAGAGAGSSPTGTETQAAAGSGASTETSAAAAAAAVEARAANTSPSQMSPQGAEEGVAHPKHDEPRVGRGSPQDAQMTDYGMPQSIPEPVRKYEQAHPSSAEPQSSQRQQQREPTRESGPVEAPLTPSQPTSHGGSRTGEFQQSYGESPQVLPRPQGHQESQPSQDQRSSEGQSRQPQT